MTSGLVKRFWLTTHVSVPLVAVIGFDAVAQSVPDRYPERAVRIIVPFPAGGTVDAVMRMLAQQLVESLKQPIVVENRGGGAGSIGSIAAAKSAPDGYTLLVGTASTHGTNPVVQKALAYDPLRDFAAVGLIATTPYILVVHPAVAAKSVAELLALARAQPGRMNYGSYGSGSSNHLATELFLAASGVELVHVPYKGGAPALADLLAGQVQMMFDVFTTSAPQIKSGKLKLLAVAAAKRSALAPDAPTFAEAGLAAVDAGTFFGLFAPIGTPRPVIERINREMNTALATAQMTERLVAAGVESAGGPPERLTRAVEAELAKWTRLVRERNLRFD